VFATVPIAVVAAVLLGCGLPFPGPAQDGRDDKPPAVGSGPGGRNQSLGLNPAQELEVGRRAYRQVLREYRDRILSSDSPQTRRVQKVFANVVRAAQLPPLQQEIHLRVGGYVFEWEANVVRDEQINAFCLPGGKVVVFTGLLPVAADDDQLATVLSHETAHALAHHASERLAREDDGSIGGVLRGLEYDRMQEAEADHIGVFLMPFAGYDPDAAVRFWERMSRGQRGGRLPEILSDHPSDATRVNNLRKWAPAARAAKQEYDAGHIAPVGDNTREGRR